MAFRVGERVMVPVDEPKHKQYSPKYCGEMGTIIDDGDESVVSIEYDFMPGQKQRTSAHCLVSIEDEDGLHTSLVAALLPLFVR